jgi:uncharacterized protein (UPF0210 family)
MKRKLKELEYCLLLAIYNQDTTVLNRAKDIINEIKLELNNIQLVNNRVSFNPELIVHALNVEKIKLQLERDAKYRLFEVLEPYITTEWRKSYGHNNPNCEILSTLKIIIPKDKIKS